MTEDNPLKKMKFSISSIKTFEQCKQKFKFQYIDKIGKKVDTIDAFMGTCVHKALEDLYTYQKNGRILSLEETLKSFEDEWEANFSDKIIIANKDLTVEDFKTVGRRCVTNYYESHKPFDDMNIIDLETDETLVLEDGINYYVKIDKLACKGDTFYVCDYKTNNKLKTQGEADSDRQLALYAEWVRRNHSTENIKLIWHMVRFDQDVVSERTTEELDKLVVETIDEIKEIQSCNEWPTTVNALCNYCEFHDVCPEFSHVVKVDREIEEKHFTEDEGAKLVDEYLKVEEELAKFKPQMEPLEEKKKSLVNDIALFAKQYGYKSVGGTVKQANVKIETKASIPKEKVEEVIAILLKEGRYQDYQTFDKQKLEKEIASGKEESLTGFAEISESTKVTFAKKK